MSTFVYLDYISIVDISASIHVCDKEDYELLLYCYYYYHWGGNGCPLAKLRTDYIPGSILGILYVSTGSSFKIIL